MSIACNLAEAFRAEIVLKASKGRHGKEEVLKCLGRIVDMWSEKEDERAVHKPAGDEEDEEERLFREEFPDFTKEFVEVCERVENRDDDGEDSDDQPAHGDTSMLIDQSGASSKELPTDVNLAQEDLDAMRDMHLRTFVASASSVTDADRRLAFVMGYRASTLVAAHPERGLSGVIDGGEMDHVGVGGNLMAVGICNTLGMTKVMRGEALEEEFAGRLMAKKDLRMVSSALESIIGRIFKLLRAFPSHSVLLSVGAVAERLREKAEEEEEGRILGGLEVLLKTAQQWEQQASVRVAIGKPLKDLTDMVLRFRRVEVERLALMADGDKGTRSERRVDGESFGLGYGRL